MNTRQAQITDAATALFLSEGVGVSTAKIAKAAGVSNGTLFNAFATKQDLIDHIYKTAKTEMFAALPHHGDAPFNRANLYANWQGYLAWARANGHARQIKHLLLESGLASPQAVAEIDSMAAPLAVWFQKALDQGLIRGPSLAFVSKLVFFQIDLVITENLHGEDADMAFDMLCKSIGVSK